MFLIRLLLIVLVVGGIDTAAQPRNDRYTVKGRVVDDVGNPRADAGICLEPKVYKSKSWERFIDCIRTSGDGRFSIEIGRTKETKGEAYLLFVYVDNTGTTLRRVTPPFDWLRVREPSFEGFPVKLGRQLLIDVGDVEVQFVYGKVRLEIPSAHDNPIKWTKTFLVIRTDKGHLADATSISKEDGKDHGAQLDVALPTGKWKIELVDIGTEEKFGETDLFQVSAGVNTAIQIRRLTPIKVSLP